MNKTDEDINIAVGNFAGLKNKKWKYIFYTMSILFLCLIDQRIASLSGEGQLVFPNCMGIVIGLIALSQYSIHDFRKKRYYVWGALCLVWIPIAVVWGYHNVFFIWQWNSAVIVVALYGLVILHGLSVLRQEATLSSKKPWKKLKMNPFIFAGYLLLLIMMNLSAYDRQWPLYFLLVFGGFYLIGMSRSDSKIWIMSLMDGVILAFFIFQGLAFVFRPYDTLRYNGLYANTNMNALFYQTVYCAFLGKFCLKERQYLEEGKIKRQMLFKWIYFGLACAMWSFVLLTMCRSAMLGMAVASLLAIGYCLLFNKGNVLKKAARYFVLPCIVIILSFPVVYSAVRYLPPAFHHPVWFYDEYSVDKVHSYDSYDSPKYTNWQDVLSENFGRFLELIKPSLKVNAATNTSEAMVISSTSYRAQIYKHYFESLNFKGHTEKEHGVWLDEYYTAPHAHNVLLQYGFNFGILSGILFAVLLAATGLRLMYITYYKVRNQENIVLLLFYASIVTYGMTEIIWRNGQFPNTLLYLIPFFAWQTREL